MRTWIIILVIVYLILKFAQKCVANYIRNDEIERFKYYFRGGITTLGAVHGILWLLSIVDLITAVTLILIYIL